MRWVDGTINLMDMTLSKFWETVKDREDWHAVVRDWHRVRHDRVTEQQKSLRVEEIGSPERRRREQICFSPTLPMPTWNSLPVQWLGLQAFAA